MRNDNPVVTFWDYLLTPSGQALTSAVIALLMSLSGWINWRVHEQVKKNTKLLQEHVEAVSVPISSGGEGSQPLHIVGSQSTQGPLS